MDTPWMSKIKSMLKAIQNAIENDVALESTSQEILKAAQATQTAAESAVSFPPVVKVDTQIWSISAGNTQSKKITGNGIFYVTYDRGVYPSTIVVDGTTIFSSSATGYADPDDTFGVYPGTDSTVFPTSVEGIPIYFSKYITVTYRCASNVTSITWYTRYVLFET